MRVLLIHQIFVTPSEGGGTRHYELLKYLANKGHTVKVVASKLDYLSGKPRRYGKEKRDGLFIKYAFTLNALHKSILGRALSFLSFTFSSFLDALRFGKIDIVWGTSPPLFQAFTALLVARLRGARFVFEVRDLWIDFAEELGVMRNRLFLQLARALEKFIYAHSDRVIVNSPGFVHFVAKHVEKDRIDVIPNGVVVSDFIVDEETGKKFRKQLGVDDYFVVTYAGNIGVANDIETIIEAANLTKEYKDIRFLIVGGGLKKDAYRRKVKDMGLQNVSILDPIPKSEIPKLLAASDVCLATLRNIPLFKTTYPNKVFDYMAAGKSTILLIDGMIREVIEKAEGGIFVPPGDSQALKEAILRYYKNPELRKHHGENARRYVREHFDRRLLFLNFLEVLNELLDLKRK